jgi:glycosyltransferase involved in cell wall biosynthesis
MNILITSFSFPSLKHNIHDGRFVFSEAMGYAKNGAKVKVITPHYPGEDKREQLNENIEIIRFQYFFPNSLEMLKKPGLPIYQQRSFLAFIQIPLLCIFFALSILRHARWADIIHAQWTVTALFSLPAKWILVKCLVLTARGSDLRLLPRWLNRFIHRRVDGAIDCFGPQPWNLEYKRNFPASYIRLPLIVDNESSGIIPQDIRQVLDNKPDAFVILYVGRFDKIKIEENRLPLIDLIVASKTLKAKGINFHVFYIGDGEKRIRETMVRLIDKYELHDTVTLLGVKTNVPDYIPFCHIGIGGVAFNAVSHEFTINGKAQILAEWSDNANTPWHDGTNAIFIRPGDQADLKEKLQWAMEHRARVKAIGKRAKDDMSKYIVDNKLGGSLYLREFRKLIQSE